MKPTAWMVEHEESGSCHLFRDNGIVKPWEALEKVFGPAVPLYSAKVWVNLTDKEISELYLAAGIIPWTKHTVGPNPAIGDGVYTTPLVDDGMDGDGACLEQFARLIEARLKEKNAQAI